MNYIFDRSEFQDFFDEEYIRDIESGAFQYSINLKHDFELRLYVLSIEEFIRIELKHEKLQSSIFDIGFEEIASLKLLKNENLGYTWLELYKRKADDQDCKLNELYVSINIKPSVSVTLGLP